ncbi:MAG: hypothetical protein WCY28_00730, partial [Candidatus Shapirobacteria bacterium]
GCCSGHDGVNCSAGAQSNGHVICNDGTRTSSCLYSEMVMCGGSSSGSTTTVKTVQPTSTPKPTLIIPTATHVPTKTPTSIPTLTPTSTPTLIPTEITTILPTETSAPTLTPIPTNSPQVLGETTTKPSEPLKTSDYIITFSVLGLVGFGIYKLFIKIKNKIKKLISKDKE